jgi:cell division protein FtsN
MTVTTRFTPATRQRGNTLVGIIIGLVIGLTIAVVVALAITKGATPFTDKGKAGKTADPTPGQVSDPNKPMYGNKDAAHAAAADLAKTPKAPQGDALQEAIGKIGEAKQDAAPAAAPVMSPAAPAPAAPATAAPAAAATAATQQPTAHAVAKPAAPVNAVAPAATAAAARPADAGDDKFVYYLQAGAFRELADAESARGKLALLGFEASVSDRSTDTGVLHRVRMGPYNQVETMNKVRGKLSENGVDVAVVRNQK